MRRHLSKYEEFSEGEGISQPIDDPLKTAMATANLADASAYIHRSTIP
jgi:hypothetical protein